MPLMPAYLSLISGVSVEEMQEGDFEPALRRRVMRACSGFVLGFSIVALNPTLIATWTAAATTLFSTGLVEFAPDQALPFSLAACGGIVTWFAVLIKLVRRYRDRFRVETLTTIIRLMGWFLIAIGLWFVWSFVDWLLTSG